MSQAVRGSRAVRRPACGGLAGGSVDWGGKGFSSCSFQGNQLVLNVVHLHQPGTVGGVFKVQRNRLDHAGTQFIPAISFSEYTVAQWSVEATFLRIANLED
jgi:hypothetical protein